MGWVGILDVNQGVDEEAGIVQMIQRVHVPVREELQDVFMFPKRECGEHCMPRAARATSRTWRFCSEAGILQVAQWQVPVASLHPVY
jgi:hypothetical protein